MNDLMCTLKLTRSQLILAHNAIVKTDMPEKKEKQLESVESVWWVERKKNYEGNQSIKVPYPSHERGRLYKRIDS